MRIHKQGIYSIISQFLCALSLFLFFTVNVIAQKSGLPPDQAVQIFDYSCSPEGADFDCLVPCGQADTISMLIAAPKADEITNIVIEPKIPDHLEWDGYLATPGGGTAVVVNSDPLNPTFAINPLGANNSSVVLEYGLRLVGCFHRRLPITTSASSIGFSVFGHDRVYDGDEGNYFYTTTEIEPWWEVDLGFIETINQVSLYTNSSWYDTDPASNFASAQKEGGYILISVLPFPSGNLTSLLADPNITSIYNPFDTNTGDIDILSTGGVNGRYVRYVLEDSALNPGVARKLRLAEMVLDLAPVPPLPETILTDFCQNIYYTYCGEEYIETITYDNNLNDAVSIPSVGISCSSTTFTFIGEQRTFGPINITNNGDPCSHLQDIDVVIDFDDGNASDYTMDEMRINGIVISPSDYIYDPVLNSYSFTIDGDTYYFDNSSEVVDNNLLEFGENAQIEMDFTLTGCPQGTQNANIKASYGCDGEAECQAGFCNGSGLRTDLDFQFDLIHSMTLLDPDFSEVNICNSNQFDFEITTTATPNTSPQADFYDITEIAIEVPRCFDTMYAMNGVNIGGNSLAATFWEIENEVLSMSNPADTVALLIVNIENINTDIDGPGGLDDLNGDGLYNDLPAGDTIRGNIFFGLSCPRFAECPVNLNISTTCPWTVNNYRIGAGLKDCDKPLTDTATYNTPTVNSSVDFLVEIEDILNNIDDTPGVDGLWDDLFVDATDFSTNTQFTVYLDYAVNTNNIDLTGCTTSKYFYEVQFGEMLDDVFNTLAYVPGSTSFDGTVIPDANVTFTKDATDNTALMIIEAGDNLTNIPLRRYQFDLELGDCGGGDDMESSMFHKVYETCDDGICCDTIVKACAVQELHIDKTSCGGGGSSIWKWHTETYRYNYDPDGSGDPIPLVDRKRAMLYDTMEITYQMYNTANTVDLSDPFVFEKIGFRFNFYGGDNFGDITVGDIQDEGFEQTDPHFASLTTMQIQEQHYATMNHKLRAITDNFQAAYYNAMSDTWTNLDCSNLVTMDSIWFQQLILDSNGIRIPDSTSSYPGIQTAATSAYTGIPRDGFYGYHFISEFTDCIQALANKTLQNRDTFELKFLFQIIPNPNPAIGCDELNSDTTGWNQLYLRSTAATLIRTGYGSGPMGYRDYQMPDPEYINYPLWHRIDRQDDSDQKDINDNQLEVACNRMYFEQKHTVDDCQTDVELKMIPGLQMQDGINPNPRTGLSDPLITETMTSYQGNGAPTYSPLDTWFSAEKRFNLRVDSLFIPLPSGAIYTPGSGKLCYLDADETTILEVPLEPAIINSVSLQAGSNTYQLADTGEDWHLIVDGITSPDLFVGDEFPDHVTYKYSYTKVCPAPEVVDTFMVYLEQLACDDYHYQSESYGHNESNIQNGNLGDQKIFLSEFAPMTDSPTSASTITNPGSTEVIEFDICNTGTVGTHSDYDFTGSLVTIPNGVSLIDITPRGGGTSYTYSVYQNNADGSVVYYFDNPSTSIAAAACWEYDITVTFDYCELDIYTYPVTSEAFGSCIPAADFKDLPRDQMLDCVYASSTHNLLTPEPCREATLIEPSGSPVNLCSNMDLIFRTGNSCSGGTRDNEYTIWLPQGITFLSTGLEYDLAGDLTPSAFSASGSFTSPTIDIAKSGGGFTAYTVTWDGDMGQTDPMPGNDFVTFKANIATTCDFVSGTPVKFQSTGLDNCDNIVSSETIIDTITINGAEFEDLVKVTSEFHSIEGATCGNFDFCFNGVIIPRVEASISTCVFVTIPQEITYDSITWVTPSTPPGPVIQTTDLAGNTVLQITSPTATTAYETYGFYIHTQISPTLDCQELPFSYYTVGKVELACPADPNSPCEISAILDGESFNLAIKPKVDIAEAQVNFTCSGDPTTMSYEVIAKNISLDTLTNIPYDLNAYADANGDGILDASIDVLIANTTGTIAGPFFPNDTLGIAGTFNAPLHQACNVLLEFKPNTGCGCDSISIKPEMGFDLGLPIVDGKINACDPISFEVCEEVNFSVEPASSANITQAGSMVTITMNAANYGTDPIALTLSSQFGDCPEITQSFEMGCCPAVTLDAGSFADPLCDDNGQLDLSLLAASTTATTTLWQTTGDGQFDTGGTIGTFGTASSYTPGPNDISSGSFTLSLVSPPVGCCEGIQDEVTVFVESCCGAPKCLPIQITVKRGARN